MIFLLPCLLSGREGRASRALRSLAAGRTGWRGLAGWLACCSVLLASLAPGISGMLAARDAAGSPPAGLCVAGASTRSAPGQPGHLPNLDLCPYCAVHAGSFGLPPVAFVLALLAVGAPLLGGRPPRRAIHAFQIHLPPSRAPPRGALR